MKLTSLSGKTIIVDPAHIEGAGPHVDGHSFIIVKGLKYEVQEPINEILKQT